MVGSTPSASLVTVTVTSTASVRPCSSVATTFISYLLSASASAGLSKSGGLRKVSTPPGLTSKARPSVPVTDQPTGRPWGSLARKVCTGPVPLSR